MAQAHQDLEATVEYMDTLQIVYDSNKRRDPNGSRTFYQGMEPLRAIKARLVASGEPNRVNLTWADRFPNVYYSLDGTWWICKLCVQEKDSNQQMKGMIECQSVQLSVKSLYDARCLFSMFSQVKHGIQKKPKIQHIHL